MEAVAVLALYSVLPAYERFIVYVPVAEGAVNGAVAMPRELVSEVCVEPWRTKVTVAPEMGVEPSWSWATA